LTHIKVAFVSQPWNCCPPIHGGSIAIWTHKIAKRLARECEVLVYARAGSQPKEEVSEGVTYRRVATDLDERLVRRLRQVSRLLSVRRPLHSRPVYYLAYILQVALDLRARDCDVVHVFNFSQFVPIIRLLNPQTRIALNMRCEWLSQLKRSVASRRLTKTDLVIGCSEYITRRIARRFPQFAPRCVTVPNGVDIETFSPDTTPRKRSRDRTKRLLFVGRISPEKGLHVLIDALPHILARCPSVTLEIVGREEMTPVDFVVALSDDERVSNLIAFYDGTSYLQRLETRIQEQGLSRIVSFAGYVPHEQVPAHYRSADILVNPSFTESFGRSLIEAMSCGLPVVASRVGGMTEVLDGGDCGLLVEPGDAQALAKAVTAVLCDGDWCARMCRSARERVITRYSWDVVARQLLGEYKRIVADGP